MDEVGLLIRTRWIAPLALYNVAALFFMHKWQCPLTWACPEWSRGDLKYTSSTLTKTSTARRKLCWVKADIQQVSVIFAYFVIKILQYLWPTNNKCIQKHMPSAWYKEGTVQGSSRKIKLKKITQVLAGPEETALYTTDVYNEVKITGIWTKIGPRYSKTISVSVSENKFTWLHCYHMSQSGVREKSPSQQ